jgi:hypothetical protein
MASRPNRACAVEEDALPLCLRATSRSPFGSGHPHRARLDEGGVKPISESGLPTILRSGGFGRRVKRSARRLRNV